MRSILKFLMTLVLIAVIAVGGLLGWLTAVEFQPAPVEKAELVSSGVNSPVKTDEDLSLLCWNIGYGGLGKNEAAANCQSHRTETSRSLIWTASAAPLPSRPPTLSSCRKWIPIPPVPTGWTSAAILTRV